MAGRLAAYTNGTANAAMRRFAGEFRHGRILGGGLAGSLVILSIVSSQRLSQKKSSEISDFGRKNVLF
jgi:hypothetical protein